MWISLKLEEVDNETMEILKAVYAKSINFMKLQNEKLKDFETTRRLKHEYILPLYVRYSSREGKTKNDTPNLGTRTQSVSM